MLEETISNSYAIMTLQVFVSFVVVPWLSVMVLNKTALDYCVKCYPSAGSEVSLFLKQVTKRYWVAVFALLLLSSVIVGHAVINHSELFGWDNQSGIIVLYLLAMLPVVLMILNQKTLFKIIKNYAGSKRSALLKPRRLTDFLPPQLLILIALANGFFVVTVLYFVEHPFEGFAGYVNLVGMLFLNVLCGVGTYVVYKGSTSENVNNPAHREAFKQKIIHINLIILALTLLHLSLSLWVSGSEFADFKLVTQSLYLQLVLIASALTLSLPRKLFEA